MGPIYAKPKEPQEVIKSVPHFLRWEHLWIALAVIALAVPVLLVLHDYLELDLIQWHVPGRHWLGRLLHDWSDCMFLAICLLLCLLVFLIGKRRGWWSTQS